MILIRIFLVIFLFFGLSFLITNILNIEIEHFKCQNCEKDECTNMSKYVDMDKYDQDRQNYFEQINSKNALLSEVNQSIDTILPKYQQTIHNLSNSIKDYQNNQNKVDKLTKEVDIYQQQHEECQKKMNNIENMKGFVQYDERQKEILNS